MDDYVLVLIFFIQFFHGRQVIAAQAFANAVQSSLRIFNSNMVLMCICRVRWRSWEYTDIGYIFITEGGIGSAS